MSDHPIGKLMKPAAAGGLWARLLWWGVPALVVSFGVLRSVGSRESALFAASQSLFVIVLWAGVAGSAAARRSTPPGATERVVWTIVGMGALALAAGQTYLSVYQVLVDARGPLGTSVTDALNIVGTLAFAWALMTAVPPSAVPRVVKARRVIDAAGVTVVGFAIAYALLSELAPTVGSSVTSDVLDATYVVLGLFMLGAVALNGLTPRCRRWMPWEGVLLAALGLYGASVLFAPVWRAFVVQAGTQLGELVLATTFFCSYCLIFVAASFRTLASEETPVASSEVRQSGTSSPDVGAFVTSTILLVAIPALGVAAFRAPLASTHAAVYFTTMALVGSAMVVRMGLDAVYRGRLRTRAGSDPLTGLADLRTFQARLADAVRAHERYDEPLSVIVFDVNDFRWVNTLYGVQEGDRLLRDAAHAVRAVAPDKAAVGRLGGDEFAVLLEQTAKPDAVAWAARMREALHEVPTSAGRPLTASWGVASCPEDSRRSRDLISKAYAAQFSGKTRGKDLIVAYSADIARMVDHVARMAAGGERSEIDMLLAVAVALEARHEAMRFHSRNVAALAVRVGERIGMSPPETSELEVAALLHDIGKIGVPDEVLTNRGPRSRAEESLFREHAVVGERIVEASGFRRVASAIRAHHERWDGSGYPDGLAGEEIPLIARVIAACDAFEGMTAGRPDRSALSPAAAVQDLDQNMGFAYDPEIVEALLAAVSEPPYRTSSGRDGTGWTL